MAMSSWRRLPCWPACALLSATSSSRTRPRVESQQRRLALKRVDDWLERYRRFWEQSLDRLEDYLHEVQAQEKSKAGKPKRPRKT